MPVQCFPCVHALETLLFFTMRPHDFCTVSTPAIQPYSMAGMSIDSLCAETKKFGAKKHGGADSPATPRSPQAEGAPAAASQEPTTRNAILSKIAQADVTGGPAGGAHGRDIRSKFVSASKKVRAYQRATCFCKL